MEAFLQFDHIHTAQDIIYKPQEKWGTPSSSKQTSMRRLEGKWMGQGTYLREEK